MSNSGEVPWSVGRELTAAATAAAPPGADGVRGVGATDWDVSGDGDGVVAAGVDRLALARQLGLLLLPPLRQAVEQAERVLRCPV